MSGFVKTAFEPGDRVLIDWYGTEKSGTFVKYDPDPNHACPDTHITYPGMRIAHFRQDDSDREHTLWEEKLSPLTHDPRAKEIERLHFQIGSKRERIEQLTREIAADEARVAVLTQQIEASPHRTANVGV